MLYKHITGYEVYAYQYDGDDIGRLIEVCKLRELDAVDITIMSDLLIINNMHVVKDNWVVRWDKAIFVLNDISFRQQFKQLF